MCGDHEEQPEDYWSEDDESLPYDEEDEVLA